MTTTTTFDGVGRATQTVSGTVTRSTTYDKSGHALAVTTTSATGVYDHAVDLRWPGPGHRQCRQLWWKRWPNANLTTTTTYDAAGDAVKVVDPKGVETDTTYAIDGSVVSTTVHDPTGDVTTANTYSGGTKTSSTSTVGNVTTQIDYDGVGRVLDTIVDPSGLALETRNAYDASGREIATRNPAGMVTLTVYDSQGREAATILNCSDTTPGSLPPLASWASPAPARASTTAPGTRSRATATTTPATRPASPPPTAQSPRTPTTTRAT